MGGSTPVGIDRPFSHHLRQHSLRRSQEGESDPKQNAPDSLRVVRRKSNSPPPKTAQSQLTKWRCWCEWPNRASDARNNVLVTTETCNRSTQPSFAPPLTSPTSPAETPRSSYGLLLTLCASQEQSPLFSLSPLPAAVLSEPSPISLFAPAPSCGVTPLILFGPVGLPAGMLTTRLMTRSLRLLGLCSLHVPAPACAQREAAEAHCLGFPLFPLGI
jgi:hypothetical protein